MLKLDKSRPFGVVHGVSEGAYEQDGVLFDGLGVAVDGQGAMPEIEKAMAVKDTAVDPDEFEARVKSLMKKHHAVLANMVEGLIPKLAKKNVHVKVATGAGSKLANARTIATHVD